LGPNDPAIVLRDSSGVMIDQNDSWQTIDDDSGSDTGLTEELDEASFGPTDTHESALWPTFRPGSYTVQLSGVNGATGIGLIEFYEY
jgi:hypothetical protein